MNALTLKELVVDVIEPNGRCRRGAEACRVGQNITFDLEALESFSSRRWQPLVYDLLLLAAAVEFCDRTLVRSSMNWGRRFTLYIPVHEPYRWNDASVNRALTEALNLLTGDDWHFVFRVLKSPATPPTQERMTFPADAEAVIAYSDGMDSQAVAALEGKRLGKRLVRLRVGNKQHDISKRERKEMPFKAIPYDVKLNKKNGESSARSRGFKFSVVSAVAAYLIEAPAAIVPESGQGALAPVLLPVGHGYEDYRNHPAFTSQMERFVFALLNHRVKFQFPRLWATKGETLREFVESCDAGAKWQKTRSCWQNSRQISVDGARRQCGVCAACILRRLSVHAAGLTESQDIYVWESLRANQWKEGAAKQFSQFTKALHEYSIAGVLHFEHLAALPGSSHYEVIKRLKTYELARSLGQAPQDVSQKLDRLLLQHAKEWSAFTNDLGPRSFVRQWIDEAP